MHGAVGQAELHVTTAAASATLLPFRKLKAGQVGDEVRFPLMSTRFDRTELAFTGEVSSLFGALAEVEVVVENEPRAVHQIQDQRKIGQRREARRLRSRSIEVLVRSIYRN